MIDIIKQIRVAQTVRGKNDIGTWRRAITSAESVIMPRKQALLDLYDEVMLDGHLYAVTQKRKTAITNTPLLFVENGAENQEIADLVNTDSFTLLLGFILESKLYGHSLIELNFDDRRLKPVLIPRKNVLAERGEILRNVSDTGGFSYREKPYTDYLLEVGEDGDLGILLQCCQYILFKRGGFSDAFSFCQIFGQPFRVAYFSSHDDATRLQLQESMKAMGSAPWAVVPDTAKMEFVQSNYQGAGEMYQILINLCNKEVSKIVLMQTSTVENVGSTSYAQAKVHEAGERSIHDADKLFVKNVLNDKLIPLLRYHGFNVGNGRFLFKESEFIDKPTKLNMDISMVKELGLKIDEDYFYTQYNIPKPKNNLKDIEQDGRKLDE